MIIDLGKSNFIFEAEETYHFKNDSYPEDIIFSTLQDIEKETGQKIKDEIDRRLNLLREIEFEKNGDKIGIWLYVAPKPIKYPPFGQKDIGDKLLVIVQDNKLLTMYWKHKFEGQYDYGIKFDDLIDFANSSYYDPIKKPFNIKRFNAWKESLKKKTNKREKYKVIKLSNGEKIKFFPETISFEKMNGEKVELDNVFDLLPKDLQEKIYEVI
jgi:hypothetical protein